MFCTSKNSCIFVGELGHGSLSSSGFTGGGDFYSAHISNGIDCSNPSDSRPKSAIETPKYRIRQSFFIDIDSFLNRNMGVSVKNATGKKNSTPESTQTERNAVSENRITVSKETSAWLMLLKEFDLFYHKVFDALMPLYGEMESEQILFDKYYELHDAVHNFLEFYMCRSIDDHIGRLSESIQI